MLESPDMDLVGIVEIPQKVEDVKKKVKDIPVATDIKELGHVDVAILAIGSRAVSNVAPLYLKMGINTVDAYDIHGDATMKLKQNWMK